MEKRVTIQDIANMACVSKSSVSRYLNNGYVSSENSQKIRDAIEKTGFETNFFASRLKRNKSNLIGIVIPRVNSVTSGHFLDGVLSELEKNNYQGLILMSNLDNKKEIENIKSFSQQGVDGIIVYSTGITKEHVKVVSSLKIPVIFSGQKNDYLNYITIDDYKAGYILGEYMKKKNHKKAVFLGVSEIDEAVGVNRKTGFIDGFSKDNDNAEVNYIETGFTIKESYNVAHEITNYNAECIVGATDNICFGVYKYFNEHGLSLRDISIAGFGGYPTNDVLNPPLTSISFDYEIIGKDVAKEIIELIEGINDNIQKSVYDSFKLININNTNDDIEK